MIVDPLTTHHFVEWGGRVLRQKKEKHMSSNCLFSIFHDFGRQSGSDSKNVFSQSIHHRPLAGDTLHPRCHTLSSWCTYCTPIIISRFLVVWTGNPRQPNTLLEKKTKKQVCQPLSPAVINQLLVFAVCCCLLTALFSPWDGQFSQNDFPSHLWPNKHFWTQGGAQASVRERSLLPMVIIKSCFYSGHDDITKYWLAAMAEMLVSVISFSYW